MLNNKRNGITLMELLVAIPMLALVAVSVTYSLGSSSRFTGTQIARVKCQVAATNLLTLIKAASGTASLDTFEEYLSGVSSVNGVVSGELKKNTIAHPDGGINLEAEAEILANDDLAHGTIDNILRLRVYAPDFDMRSEIKTYFAH